MDTTEMKKLEMEEEDEENRILGGIREVEGSVIDPKINSLAHFAIEQHNKEENAILEFMRVVNVKVQDVAGTSYYITLEAKVGENVNVYEANIWERVWINLKELTKFKLIGGDAADAPSVDSAKIICDMSPTQVETTCPNVIEEPNGTKEKAIVDE
ncbi:hypothetical protein TSUD_131330 [Trifolium subterraneum]|uniref:Cysteine proteinase inhibitor n=1 Tax=Trifolium subterraneum TaxID=3900 RepID=A0A2Z6P9R3_TRISU|nr:hypothetical protein TSUD_131330 [Trifolium subterraneum]